MATSFQQLKHATIEENQSRGEAELWSPYASQGEISERTSRLNPKEEAGAGTQWPLDFSDADRASHFLLVVINTKQNE